jgi:hypothetical protein
LHVGPHCGRTPAGAGNGLVHGVWQATAGAVRELDRRQGGQQSIITPVFAGLDFGTGLTPQGLQNGHGLCVHPWVKGFRRNVHVLAPWRDRRRSWCPCRVGRTPRATPHAGAAAWACHRRRTLDKAAATDRGFEVVGRLELGEHGDRTAWTGRHGSLLGMV